MAISTYIKGLVNERVKTLRAKHTTVLERIAKKQAMINDYENAKAILVKEARSYLKEINTIKNEISSTKTELGV